MKWNININQKKSLEWGLSLQQAAFIAVIGELFTWADGIIIKEKVYYYLSAGKIASEIPIITTKKNTVLKILRELLEKNIIIRHKQNNKSYYKLTEKGLSYFKKNKEGGSDKNQDKGGNKSTEGMDLNQDNNNTIYNNTNIIKKKEKKKAFKLSKEDTEEVLNYYVSSISRIGIYNKKYHKKALSIERIIKTSLEKPILMSLIDTYIKNNREQVASGYGKMCQYFFGPVERGSSVFYYEDFLEEAKEQKGNNVGEPPVKKKAVDVTELF